MADKYIKNIVVVMSYRKIDNRSFLLISTNETGHKI